MVITQIPPIWTDRDNCFRCRTTFSAFTRKHHCRACGETFCATCSSKQCPLVEYGIDVDVRVCLTCYDRIQTTGSVRPQTRTINKATGRSQVEFDDDDALQLALQLSQNEAEERERQKKSLTQQYANLTIDSPPTPIGSAPLPDNTYEQTYWEMQTKTDLITIKPFVNNNSNQFVNDDDIDKFTNAVNEHINNMKFRMLSNEQRGRNIANDTAVQSVFIQLQNMYPQLQRFIKSLDEKQAYYESLQDKLNQLKDAREALNALREEHNENKKRQILERERQRQMQMALKLDDMRKKKQAYLEYQRQVHLQRLAEQEAEMKARLDQQRRYIQQREQINQVPYVAPQPVEYYHPIGPIQYPIGQTSNIVSTVYSQPYTNEIQSQSLPKSNEETLISFD